MTEPDPPFDAWWEAVPVSPPDYEPPNLETTEVALIGTLRRLIDEYGLKGVRSALVLIEERGWDQ